MDVLLSLDDQAMQRMLALTGLTRPTDLTRDALTLLQWAIEERAKGRVILSAEADGSDPKRLATRALDSAAALGAASNLEG